MAISWRICKHTSASLYPYNIYSFCFFEPSLLCRFSSELLEHFFWDIMAVAVQVLREFSLWIPSLTVSIYLQMHNHCAFVNIIDQTNSSIIAFERCRWFCCDWALCDVNADWFSRDGMFGTALVDPPHTSLASFILTSQMLDLSLRCVMSRDGRFALLWMECETMKEE